MSDFDWFTTDYDYSGYAEAVFDEPHVELDGPASVKPDEDGSPIVEITVDRSSPTVRTQFDLMEVCYGSRPTPGGKVIAVGGDSQNRVRATIRGKEGVFQCGPDWSYNLSFAPGEQLILRINPLKSEFTVVAPAPEALLVLPLAGFTPEFPAAASRICTHPFQSWKPE
jgi:hypothetical protein